MNKIIKTCDLTLNNIIFYKNDLWVVIYAVNKIIVMNIANHDLQEEYKQITALLHISN